MTNHHNDARYPNRYARLAGILYLCQIIIGIFNEFAVKGKIMVSDNIVGTAAHLMAMESLWRIGILGELINLLISVPLAYSLYVLLSPCNRRLSLLALIFALVATAIEGAYTLRLIDALLPLNALYHDVGFTASQQAELVHLAIRSHVIGFGVALLFFGPYFLITGHLISTSGLFPKLIGGLYVLTGISYMANTVVLVLYPKLAGSAFMIAAPFAFVGEVSLSLWLLVKGVDERRWREAAPSP